MHLQIKYCGAVPCSKIELHLYLFCTVLEADEDWPEHLSAQADRSGQTVEVAFFKAQAVAKAQRLLLADAPI